MDVSKGFAGLSQNCHGKEDVSALADENMASLIVSTSSLATDNEDAKA